MLIVVQRGPCGYVFVYVQSMKILCTEARELFNIQVDCSASLWPYNLENDLVPRRNRMDLLAVICPEMELVS